MCNGTNCFSPNGGGIYDSNAGAYAGTWGVGDGAWTPAYWQPGYWLALSAGK